MSCPTAEQQFAIETAREELERGMLELSPHHPAFGPLALARAHILRALSGWGITVPQPTDPRPDMGSCFDPADEDDRRSRREWIARSIPF